MDWLTRFINKYSWQRQININTYRTNNHPNMFQQMPNNQSFNVDEEPQDTDWSSGNQDFTNNDFDYNGSTDIDTNDCNFDGDCSSTGDEE